MSPVHSLPYIETQIQRDVHLLRNSTKKYLHEYESTHGSIFKSLSTSQIRENKSDVNEFFSQLFKAFTESELDVFNHLTMSTWKKNGRITGGSPTPLTDAQQPSPIFKMEKIKGPADLPHPRILETLRHQYESGRLDAGSGDGGDRYIPRIIYRFIREKAEFHLQFQYRINDRDITIHFITFPDSKITICQSKGGTNQMCSTEIAMYQTYAHKVFLWLSMVTRISDQECSGTSLNIYFYMTPFKKNIPGATPSTKEGDALSAIHVNTGLTRKCEDQGEIVIYRTEEWFKVFVHESIHNFCIDFDDDNELPKMNEKLRGTFCIPHGDILLFETYTETWARIINAAFDAYLDQNIRNQTAFIRQVRENLELNAMFSACQIVKILDLMDLRYAHLTIRSKENEMVCRKQYKEATNVYAYYILGGLLSVNMNQFISWCIHHNRHTSKTIRNSYRRNPYMDAIRFLSKPNSGGRGGVLYEFIDFMGDLSRDSRILSVISFCEKQHDKNEKKMAAHHKTMNDELRFATTMRMTL